MDLEIYDKTEKGVSEKDQKLIRDVLDFAGSYIHLADNTEMSVTLVNNDEIHQINKKYRGVDRATDVISFAIEDDDDDDFPIVMDKELKEAIQKTLAIFLFLSIKLLNKLIILDTHLNANLDSYVSMDFYT